MRINDMKHLKCITLQTQFSSFSAIQPQLHLNLKTAHCWDNVRLRIQVIFSLIDIELPHNELKCGQFYAFSPLKFSIHKKVTFFTQKKTVSLNMFLTLRKSMWRVGFHCWTLIYYDNFFSIFIFSVYHKKVTKRKKSIL